MRNLRGLLEASAGVEPAMADLQSAALATWPRRLIFACVMRLAPEIIATDFNGQEDWLLWDASASWE